MHPLPVAIPPGGCVDFFVNTIDDPAFVCGDVLTLVGRHLNDNQIG